MIRLKKSFLFVLPILLLAASCKKDTVNNAGGAPPNINPNANNFRFIAQGNSHEVTTFVLQDLGDIIYIHHEDTLNTNFGFKFNKSIEPGNYDFGYDSDFEFIYALYLPGAENYHSINDSGSITITKNDTENRILKGNFQCPVARIDNPNDITLITAGAFCINY